MPKRKLRFFRQHTMKTCGISCILMLLDYYRKVSYPTPKQEAKLYRLYHSRAYMGVSPAAAARCLDWNGFPLELYHSSPDYLENRDGYFPEEIFQPFMEEYRQYLAQCSENVKVYTGSNVTTNLLRQKLQEGSHAMVQVFIPGDADGMHTEVLHWVLVYGWENGDFLLIDPLSGRLRLTAQALEQYMDTPIGQIILSVNPPTQLINQPRGGNTMYKAIKEIKEFFEGKDLKFSTDQMKDNWIIHLTMNGKKGSYDFLFIKDDDVGNDVAVRVFKVESFQEHQWDKALEVLAELQNKYRYIRFTLDSDGDVTASYDFPVKTEDIGEGAFEILIRMTQILDEVQPVLLRASWD